MYFIYISEKDFLHSFLKSDLQKWNFIILFFVMERTREPNSCQSEYKSNVDKINIRNEQNSDLIELSKNSPVSLRFKDKCSDSEESSEKDISEEKVRKEEMNEILDVETAHYRNMFYSDNSSDSELEITYVTPRSLLSASSYFPFNAMKSVNGDSMRTSPNDENEIYELTDDMRYLSMDHLKEINPSEQRFSSKRRNMTFTNEELMKIERDNQILLGRIMKFRKPHIKSKTENVKTRLSSSAINRRKLQKKIAEDNLLIGRKIREAKPCILPRAKSASCRLSFH